ncbi:MAG: T9SS type A sorting domain-containing protein [Flavobacteriales bacterium]
MLKTHFQRSTLLMLMVIVFHQFSNAQPVARIWDDTQLACIRLSLARPTVHALHLKRMGIAMYDAWAAYDDVAAPYMLGNTHGSFTCPFDGIPAVADANVEAFRDEAISYAAYWYLKNHYPQQAVGLNPGIINDLLDSTMVQLGYSINYYSTNYSNGSPADLGCYIASMLDEWSNVDGSNEQNNYANQIYDTVNMELNPNLSGNPGAIFPNQWQSIDLAVCTDQAGNPIPCAGNASIPALSPEWGWVDPFSLTECQLSYHERDGVQWPVYLDQGAPPYLESTDYLPENLLGPNVNMFKFGFLTTLMWHWFHNNTASGTIDTSPNNVGGFNIVLNPEAGQMGPDDLPTTLQEYYDFYPLFTGQVNDPGYTTNPNTGLPYEPQIAEMADYSRAIAQYWADGPKSETPPGHWFKILNEVSDQLPSKLWKGTEPVNELEWYVKSYFTLGGAVHDAAIACWSTKGAYDYTRPLAAIRTLAEFGQCTDSALPNYHVNGLPLIPGYIEMVNQADIDDTTMNFDQGDLNQIKIATWLGPYGLSIPSGWQGTQQDGHGWKLALDWWTYQVATFVTPPFQGYYSGHSTYSRTAAEVLTQITGSEYFPGGMFEFVVDTLFADTFHYPINPVHLQWATYRDASDQCSLSRIFGGLHPPQDDIPGRRVGLIIGNQVVEYAERFMYANRPQVLSMGVNEINPVTGDFDFSVAVTFNQAMDTGSMLQLTTTDPDVGALLTEVNSYWSNDSIFVSEYSVPEGNGSLIGIAFDVEGYTPAEWIVVESCTLDTINTPLGYNPVPFDIDLKAPICEATAINDFFTDADFGSVWTVELSFDEPVNESSFDLANAISDMDFNTNLDFVAANWIDPQHAIIEYSVLDANVELILPINVSFTGTDFAGNTVQGCVLNNTHTIDTDNPVALIGDPAPDFVVSDSEALSGTFSFPIYFNDIMDTSILPELIYSNDDPTVSTLSLDSLVWQNESSLMAYYSVSDSNEELDNIILLIDGATDNNGNPMQPGDFMQPFAVDTRNPLIANFSLSETLIDINNQSAGFEVSVTYDETMDGLNAPTFSMLEAGSSLTPGAANWDAAALTYTQPYSIASSNFEILNIDVTVSAAATDLAGNFSLADTLTDALDIQLIGIAEIASNEWSLYPNPVQSGAAVTLQSNYAIESVEVFDMLGKTIFISEQLNRSQYILAIPQWCAGYYQVRITTSEGSAIKPLLVTEIR